MARGDDIRRIPVMQEDVFGRDVQARDGLVRPRVRTGAVDPMRERLGRKINKQHATLTSSGQMMREAASGRTGGMLIDNLPSGAGMSTGYFDAYRTSYARGLGIEGGATYDIPTYFVMMNEQNGGIIYWPTTLKEKYGWYRYFARTDAYVGRALELLCDLPMSKITLNMPRHVKDKKKRDEILEFYEYQCQRIGLFNVLQSGVWEMNMMGQAFPFHEWDAKMKMWSNVTFLPPEEVGVFQYPFSQDRMVQYRPERLIRLINEYGDGDPDKDDDSLAAEIVRRIPKDLRKMVQDQGAIIMDTDPMTGSFVFQLARRRTPYMDLAPSLLERILVPMLQKENYRYTQLSLASRNMTPKNVVTAPSLTRDETEDLRTQVDLSYMDPEYSIVANYEIDWQQVGADQRLLDLDREYELIDNQVFAALGVTRELLTGEGSFSGNKITVEILNTMFLLTRVLLTDYVEQQLFLPVADAHGWYDETDYGFRRYYYPRLGFNRLTIRDNAEVFDSLFQLYQKGSLPIDVLFDLFNLDPDTMHEKIKRDLFTVKDTNFNRIIEDTSSEVGRTLPDRTDIIKKVSKYLGLEYKEEEEEGGGDEFGGGGSFGGFGGEEGEEVPGVESEAEQEVPGIETETEEAEQEVPGIETEDEPQKPKGQAEKPSEKRTKAQVMQGVIDRSLKRLKPGATLEEIRDVVMKETEAA